VSKKREREEKGPDPPPLRTLQKREKKKPSLESFLYFPLRWKKKRRNTFRVAFLYLPRIMKRKKEKEDWAPSSYSLTGRRRYFPIPEAPDEKKKEKEGSRARGASLLFTK